MDNFLYLMPASNGDVFMSTSVINGIKKKHPDSVITFATNPPFFSLLEGNPDIAHIIKYEKKFIRSKVWHKFQQDGKYNAVFAPHIITQTGYTNWFQGGYGNNLVYAYAKYCNVEPGSFYIKYLPIDLPKDPYITIHVGSGKKRWNAKKYNHWQKVVDILPKQYNIIQIGDIGEPLLNGVIDLRSKTIYPQLAYLLKYSKLHVGIDSFPMWLAGAIGTNLVALFGNTCSKNCGFPVSLKKEEQKIIFLEPEYRYSCMCCCHYKSCTVNKYSPCVNLINPEKIAESILTIIK